jgi:hypothetical protein
MCPESIDWEKAKKDAEAEKTALDAQRQLLESRRALSAAQAQPDPAKKAADDQLIAIKVGKELTDAHRSAAEARKAQAEASLAALKSQIGEVTASGYTGDVSLKDRAGAMEAALLAAKAVNTAAARILAELPKQDGAKKNVLLFAAAEVPTLQAFLAFRVQTALVTKAFDDARHVSTPTGEPASSSDLAQATFLPVAAAAGLTLDAVNKLLGYFRTDYTIGGIDISWDDTILIHSLAGKIAKSDRNLSVQLPAVYNARALADGEKSIFDELLRLATLRRDAQAEAIQRDARAAQLTEEAGKETDRVKQQELLNAAKLDKSAADAARAAIGIYEGFLAKVTTCDDKGGVSLTNVIRESAVAGALLGSDLLLLVKVQRSGGAYYTKKNLWSFLGGMPFFHMGGVVVSYALMEGNTGTVLRSGVVPVHGGFLGASEVQESLT